MIYYKNFVNKDKIVIHATEYEGKKFRYFIRIPFFRDGSDVVLVVMMNPSKANSEESDQTVNKVLTRIYNECKNVGIVVITNLYPLYETYSASLVLYKQQSEINLQKIEETLYSVDFALLGWGKPHNTTAKKLKEIKYYEYACKVVKMRQTKNIKAFKVGDPRENLYPKHLGRAPYSTLMSELDLKALSNKMECK